MLAYPTTISCLATLSLWFAAIVWFDLRERRIPNAWVAAGMGCGLAIQVLAPAGSGLFDASWGGIGALQSTLGLLEGLALFMPLYLLRFVGAGDVKLLAMSGVWLGPQMLLGAALLSLLAGGVLSVAAMIATRSSREVLGNVRMLLLHPSAAAALPALSSRRARLPYALAIAAGTLVQAAWQIWGAGR